MTKFKSVINCNDKETVNNLIMLLKEHETPNKFCEMVGKANYINVVYYDNIGYVVKSSVHGRYYLCLSITETNEGFKYTYVKCERI